jgi:hypothetical protein
MSRRKCRVSAFNRRPVFAARHEAPQWRQPIGVLRWNALFGSETRSPGAQFLVPTPGCSLERAGFQFERSESSVESLDFYSARPEMSPPCSTWNVHDDRHPRQIPCRIPGCLYVARSRPPGGERRLSVDGRFPVAEFSSSTITLESPSSARVAAESTAVEPRSVPAPACVATPLGLSHLAVSMSRADAARLDP